MDNKTAHNKLKELRDSLSKVLDGETYSSAEEIKEQSQEAIKQARSASKTLKKSLLERIKDIPVVNQVSQLGAAGTVAVSTAAVTQVDIAKDRTEVFVAEVANDVVEERFEVPMFIDNYVDFYHLNDWGQQVIAEKVAEVSELPQTAQPSSVDGDTKPAPSASSQDTPADKSSQKPATGQDQQQTETKSKTEETKSSNDKQEGKEQKGSEQDKSSKDNDSKEDNKGKPETTQEQKTEGKPESQQVKASSESNEQPKAVKAIPIVPTPFEPMGDDIKPHSSIRVVSPTS